MKKYYKTELHAHTKPASMCSEIETKEMAKIYKENGYDSLVITNHFALSMKGETEKDKIERYLEDYYTCADEGKRLGINVILGAELRFEENTNDYLIFGLCPEDLNDIIKLLPYGIDNFYKEYKNERNVILQAHPFRDDTQQVSPKSLDGIEVFNMHPSHNSRIGIAAKYAKRHNMIATCGSDFHHPGQECLCGILTEKPLKTSYDVAQVLKKGAFKMEVGGFLVDL